MRERLNTHAIKLRLLALVLALALTWYAMNPAPGPVRRGRRDEEQPDEKRREGKSPRPNYPAVVGTEADDCESLPDPLLSPSEDVDDLEWPDVIEVG